MELPYAATGSIVVENSEWNNEILIALLVATHCGAPMKDAKSRGPFCRETTLVRVPRHVIRESLCNFRCINPTSLLLSSPPPFPAFPIFPRRNKRPDFACVSSKDRVWSVLRRSTTGRLSIRTRRPAQRPFLLPPLRARCHQHKG